MKRRILLTSILTIALCFSLMAGATFALFTSESNVNVAITSGKVNVTAEAQNFKVYSGQWNETDLAYESVEQQDMTFATKGTVAVDENNITVTNMAPMDKVTFEIVIKNNSNIVVQYQTIISSVSESATNLLDALEIEIVDTATSVVPTTKVGNSVISDWSLIAPVAEGQDNTVTTLNVSILLPEGTGNEYQGLAANLTYTVKAIQGNAHTVNPEVEEGVVQIYTVEDLKALAASVNSGTTYFGKTVKLMADLDLNNEEWTPIGNSSNPFSGTFDGNGLTISNLYINKEGSSNLGLFGKTTNGEIKNLTLVNANVKGYLNVAALSGTPYTSKYTNIKILGDVKVEGFAYVGAVGGKNAYANWDNITVDVNEGSCVKANSVDGTTAYRTYVGGVIGFMGEGGHTVSNVTSNINVEGSTCDVGGIVGIAHYNNNFINVECTGNVTLVNATDAGDELEIGGIAGVWHNEDGTSVTLINCKYEGSLKSYLEGVEVTAFKNDGLVGKAYSVNGTGKLNIIDSNNITTQAELEALNNKGIQAVIQEGTILELEDLNFTNGVVGAAAIVNNGTLTIKSGTYGNGNIAAANGAHVIANYGTLVIENGNFGTDGESGSAIRNYGGNVTINGGNFGSCDRSKDKYGDYSDSTKPYRYAYVFTTDGGIITINNATVDCNPHGMFSPYNGGKIVVNGGTFKMAGKGTTYNLVYSYNSGVTELNGGTFEWYAGDTLSPVNLSSNSILTISDACVKKGHTNWVNYVVE